jgi:uncharacterized phage protein (TIGR02218 family)
MRDIGEAFAAALAADVATLCACWTLTRSDGEVFGATDHDRALAFGGVTYEPARALVSAVFESSAGLAPGRASGAAALDADFLSEDDLAAGVWDGARVDIWKVDWTAPEQRVAVWSGRLSEVALANGGFTAELVSLKADLERPIGRIYGRKCDARVGDARCGVNVSTVAYRGYGSVVQVLGPKRFRATGLGAFAGGWFAGGMLSWEGGANAGSTRRVLHHAGRDLAEFELASAPRLSLQVGDAFVVSAGCDRTFGTCRTKFANGVRFRGFPHMPGPDAVLAGPLAGRVDGGRR